MGAEMVDRVRAERTASTVTPDQRAEAAVCAIYSDGVADHARARFAVMEAMAMTISAERQNCAKLLDAIRDEYIDWCATNRGSTVDQMQIVNMLSKAATLVRVRAVTATPLDQALPPPG